LMATTSNNATAEQPPPSYEEICSKKSNIKRVTSSSCEEPPAYEELNEIRHIDDHQNGVEHDSSRSTAALSEPSQSRCERNDASLQNRASCKEI
jgi:hypothetical protein